MSYYVEIVEHGSGTVARTIGPYASKGKALDGMFTAQVGLDATKHFTRITNQLTARLDAESEAQRPKDLDSKHLGGAGFCDKAPSPDTATNAAVKTNAPVSVRVAVKTPDSYEEYALMSAAEKAALWRQVGRESKERVAQQTPRVAQHYHCPGCGAVFGTSIKLAAHFAACPSCEGAADIAMVRAGLSGWGARK